MIVLCVGFLCLLSMPFATSVLTASPASDVETTSGDAKATREAAALSPSDAWPLFRGNSMATGVAGGSLPDRLELLWTFSVEKQGFESTAAIVGGTIYIGSTDGKLYAIDLTTGKKRWEFSTELGFSASAAVRDGQVFIGDSDGGFYCVDARSGKLHWKFAADAEINSSANFYRDCVLFGSQDAHLYCLKANTGEVVWKYESQDQIRCFPTIVGQQCFVAGCDSRLHKIDLQQGKSIADVQIDSPTGCAPAAMNGHVFVGTEGNAFLAVDVPTMKVFWRYENTRRASAYRGSAAVTPEAVFVGSRDKSLHALDPKTGRSLWDFATKGRIDSSPVVVGDRVFVGSSDGRIYGVDRKTGREVWRFEAGGAVNASAAVAAGRMVIGTDAGSLYCFGAKP